jgi:hypothetical protein
MKVEGNISKTTKIHFYFSIAIKQFITIFVKISFQLYELYGLYKLLTHNVKRNFNPNFR